MTELVKQISFLSTAIFTAGLAVLLSKADFLHIRIGSVIIFSASLLNISAYSEFTSASAEGHAIGLLILFVILIHLFVHKSFR